MNEPEHIKKSNQPTESESQRELVAPLPSRNIIIVLGFSAVIATLFFLFYEEKPSKPESLELDYEKALSEVEYGSSSGYEADPQMINGMRRTVETLEFACKNYGSACGEAKLTRRHLDDAIAGR